MQSADITPLFHDYFIALQSAQLHSQEIISDAEKILSSVTRTDGERIMLNAIAGNASQSSAERSDELHTENVCIENVETGSESCAENRNDKGILMISHKKMTKIVKSYNCMYTLQYVWITSLECLSLRMIVVINHNIVLNELVIIP